MNWCFHFNTLISGQKPVITRAKKSIAGFRLREGMAIGAKVTLRGQRMYEFVYSCVENLAGRLFFATCDFLANVKPPYLANGNMGVGDAVSNAKNLDEAVEELTLISGQKPVITRAKKSIKVLWILRLC